VDIKFKMGALEYFDIANLHGQTIAQKLWEAHGHQGKYIGWHIAIPAWIETTGGTVMGFEESDKASRLLKDILNDAKTDTRSP
jgi:hypothetical protein